MAKASDNEFPSLLFKEGTAPSSPTSGDQRLFIDSTDHTPKLINHAGTISPLGGGGAMTQIARQLLSTTAASVTFSSIPGSYNTLLLVAYARMDGAVGGSYAKLTANGDTTSNYDWALTDSNAGFGGGGAGPDSAMCLLFPPGASAPSGDFGGGQIMIPEYAGTTGHKMFTADGLRKDNNSGNIYVINAAGAWRSTSAITSLTLTPGSGNWVAGSAFTLYGLL